MDDPGKPDPLDPFWSLLADPHSSDNVYFIQRDHNILADFGWTGFDHCQPSDTPPPTNTSSVAGPSSSSVQSASTSSSEEHPERSVTTVPTTPEIPSKVISKKKGQKRVRQARFAFMTKSEVDHLEDGYRWRKYGQKAVKNSPFPRSYYRCTNSKCTVKKRVERSSEDPTVVITTYEGQHCHHTVGFQRSSGFLTHEGHFLGQFPPPLNPRTFFYHPPPGPQFSPSNDSISINTNTQNPTTTSSTTTLHSGHQGIIPCKIEELPPLFIPPPPRTTDPRAASPGEGLLGDIVPPGMRNRTLEDM